MEYQQQADGIELIDILRVLWKRKALIIWGTLLIAILGAGVVFLLPKTYEVVTIIQPGSRPITDEKGQIIQEKPVESPEAIKENVLGGAFDEQIQQQLNIPVGRFPKFKVELPKDTLLVKI